MSLVDIYNALKQQVEEQRPEYARHQLPGEIHLSVSGHVVLNTLNPGRSTVTVNGSIDVVLEGTPEDEVPPFSQLVNRDSILGFVRDQLATHAVGEYHAPWCSLASDGRAGFTLEGVFTNPHKARSEYDLFRMNGTMQQELGYLL